jgi:hypothetical protein
MANRIVVATLIALLARGSAMAEEYFDFGQIPGVPSEPNVEVDLNAALLAFVGEASKGSEPDLAGALSSIDGIRVRVYEELVDPAAVSAFVDDTSKKLERAAWQRMVYVRDNTDKVRVYVKMRDQQMLGMTVMVVDETDAVFINIAGTIDPAQLGRVARAMGAGNVLDGVASRRNRADERNRDAGPGDNGDRDTANGGTRAQEDAASSADER